jgi:hypothetical protein
MFRLARTILAATLAIGFAAPLYAADTQTRSPAVQTTPPYDGYKAAMKKCGNLPEVEQAKCIVNIRPTESSSAGGPVSPTSDTSAVKDGLAQKDAEYAAALRECEAVSAPERQRCIDNAKDHLGRM